METKPAIIFVRGDTNTITERLYEDCYMWAATNGYSERLTVVNDLDLLFHQWKQGDTVIVNDLSQLSRMPKVISAVLEEAAETGVVVKVVQNA